MNCIVKIQFVAELLEGIVYQNTVKIVKRTYINKKKCKNDKRKLKTCLSTHFKTQNNYLHRHKEK